PVLPWFGLVGPGRLGWPADLPRGELCSYSFPLGHPLLLRFAVSVSSQGSAWSSRHCADIGSHSATWRADVHCRLGGHPGRLLPQGLIPWNPTHAPPRSLDFRFLKVNITIMNDFGRKPKNADLSKIGLSNMGDIYWNREPAELVEHTIVNGQGVLADSGALAVDTGEFTGRSPKDKFCVKDATTENSVWWGDINIPMDPATFDRLRERMGAYMMGRDAYVHDAYACADPAFRLNLRLVAEL